MPKSAEAQRRDRIVEYLSQTLCDVGFRRHRTRFLRTTEPEMTQVVDFAMAPSWTRDAGSFGIAVGIYLKDAAEFYGEQAPKREPGVADCEVREPYGVLGPICHERSWRLAHADPVALAPSVADRLQARVIPYLDRYRSRRSLCDAHLAGFEPGFPPRADLTVAILLAASGDLRNAHALLEKYLLGIDNDRHRTWVEQRLAHSPMFSDRSKRSTRAT